MSGRQPLLDLVLGHGGGVPEVLTIGLPVAVFVGFLAMELRARRREQARREDPAEQPGPDAEPGRPS